MIARIPQLIDRGIALRRQIKELGDELKAVEELIIAYAKEGEHIPLADDEREGRQFLARGSALTVPVVFTADKIIGSFRDRSEIQGKITMALAESSIDPFYKLTHTWEMVPKDGKAFRKTAAEVLGEINSPPFITMCKARDKFGIPKSDIKIEWESAREI